MAVALRLLDLFEKGPTDKTNQTITFSGRHRHTQLTNTPFHPKHYQQGQNVTYCKTGP